MTMIKKSITVTQHQNNWIKAQVETGHFGNESEIIRELIRERQLKELETSDELATIRQALKKGEESGFSKLSVDQIWSQARNSYRLKNG